MSRTNIECVCFDKDGTLIECTALWIKWAKDLHTYISSYLSFPFLSCIDFLTAIGVSEDGKRIDPKSPLAIGSIKEAEIITAWQLYEMDVPWNDAIVISSKAIQYANQLQNQSELIQPIAGVRETLEFLRNRGIQLGVLTADDTEKAKKHLHAVGLNKYFSFILGSDLVDQGKPFPDIAYLASEKWCFQLEKTIMIGDSNGDMQLGKNAGMALSIGILPNDEVDKSYLPDADVIIDHYDVDVIRKIIDGEV
ncbi:MAG TPA: HAD family phosphatase [Rummeliibacillus sp.]|nr:HAD family phosphatase [Rummeliibacillus sp.]